MFDALDFTITVNVRGKVRQVTAQQIEEWAEWQIDENGNSSFLLDDLNDALKFILSD